jgi:hypothetical protein
LMTRRLDLNRFQYSSTERLRVLRCVADIAEIRGTTGKKQAQR